MVTKSHNPPRKRPLPPLVLWLGVLIADWCIMAPVLLIGAMMASGWVGGSSHPENFWRIVIPSLAVLSVLSVLDHLIVGVPSENHSGFFSIAASKLVEF